MGCKFCFENRLYNPSVENTKSIFILELNVHHTSFYYSTFQRLSINSTTKVILNDHSCVIRTPIPQQIVLLAETLNSSTVLHYHTTTTL